MLYVIFWNFTFFNIWEVIAVDWKFNVFYNCADCRSRTEHGIGSGSHLWVAWITGAWRTGRCLCDRIWAEPLSALFGLAGNTKEICISAIRIVSLSFVFAGINIAFQGIFQALEAGLESLIVSICRQFLFVLPVAWILSQIVIKSGNRIGLVWLTFLIAEGINCAISVLFMRRIKRK